MKRGKWFRRTLAMLMAAVLVLSAGSALAEETNQAFDVSGSKTASPVELNEDNRETTVTLSLPSAEYQNKVDIVFVMDSSTSSKGGAVFREAAQDLFDAVLENNPNIDLKVGVIRFRGRAHDAIAYLSANAFKELAPYNEAAEYISTALAMEEDEAERIFGNGSNTHGGLDIANEWLKADTGVDDANKYVVLMTDAKTYIWNDENHEPTTIYSQYYRWTRGVGLGAIQTPPADTIQEGVTVTDMKGAPFVSQSAGYNKYTKAYAVDVQDPTGQSNIFVFRKDPNDPAAAYANLYASDNPELTGKSAWDAPCYYADTRRLGTIPGTVNPIPITNGVEKLKNSGTGLNDYYTYFAFTPAEGYEDIPYLEANPYVVKVAEDGASCEFTDEINPNYYQYHVDAMQKGCYKAGHLWKEMGEIYNCGVIIYNKGSSDSVISNLVYAFREWLLSEENSKYSASVEQASQIQELFKDIKNDILYMVNRGTVTDVIGDDFDLKEQKADTFKMTLDGNDVKVTYTDGSNVWNFGEAVEGVYPYSVELSEDKRSFIWTINVPVENAHPVTLSYDLVLKDSVTESGVYDTNDSAVLNYVTTDQKEGTYTFEKPKVVYLTTTDITVKKVWEDENDKDEIRPDQIVVNLLADEEVVTEANVDAAGQWTNTFADQPQAKIVYGDAGTELPANLKKLYSKTDPETKVETFYAVTVDGATVEFTGYEVKNIEYDVNENEVDGYTADIAVGEDGVFTITNTHVPETEPETEPTTEPEEIPDETVPLAPPTEEETETETEPEEDTTAAPTTTAEEIEENDVPLTPPTVTPVTPTQPTRVPMDHGYEEIIDDEVPQALPVTGQVNWLILVLAIAGVVMLGAATIIRRQKKTEG